MERVFGVPCQARGQLESTQHNVMLDLIIIGAGPAGLSLAAEARVNGIPADRLLILEKGEAHSWSIRKFYPEAKLVEANYKGKPAVCNGVLCISDSSKDETLSYLDQAILKHQLDVHYGEGVQAIRSLPGGGFELRSVRGSYEARVCAIAIGVLGRPNKPDYKVPPGSRKRVHFDVTSETHQDQDVLVVGGGDSASEYVQYLVQCGNRVSLSYRRATFERLTPLNRESLLALELRAQVKIYRSSNIVALHDREGRPEVQFAEEELAAQVFDHIVYALGGSTPENFLREAGIEFEGKQPRLTQGYQTSIPALYLIGDLAPASGSIILAFNTAHEAMLDICKSHLGCSQATPRTANEQRPERPRRAVHLT
jgi:thioredoxin reductase (NADPH)